MEILRSFFWKAFLSKKNSQNNNNNTVKKEYHLVRNEPHTFLARKDHKTGTSTRKEKETAKVLVELK